MKVISIQYGKKLPQGLNDNDGATCNFVDFIFHDVDELARVIISQQLQVYGVTSLSVVHCTEPRWAIGPEYIVIYKDRCRVVPPRAGHSCRTYIIRQLWSIWGSKLALNGLAYCVSAGKVKSSENSENSEGKSRQVVKIVKIVKIAKICKYWLK